MRVLQVLIILCFVLLLGCTQDDVLTFGVLSDIHGDYENTEYFVDAFVDERVDGIIILGDIPLNEELRYGRKDAVADAEEIFKVLRIAAAAHVPVYVIPGNHERRPDYYAALYNVQRDYDNVHDLSKNLLMDLEGIDFIALPGYEFDVIDNQRFLLDDGFHFTQFEEESTAASYPDEHKLLVSHGPPKGVGGVGLDVIDSGEHVGSDQINQLIRERNFRFGVFGHIHESRNALTIANIPVAENQLSPTLFLNPGAVADGHAALISFVDDTAFYEYLDAPVEK